MTCPNCGLRHSMDTRMDIEWAEYQFRRKLGFIKEKNSP